MGSPTSPPPNVGPVLGSSNAQAMAPGRTKMRTLLADPEKRTALWDAISDGAKIADLAREHRIPYLVFYRFLREQCSDEYSAARAAFADTLVHKNLEMADDIEQGRVGAPEGKASAGIRQWYAERADADTWGQKSSMNVHHTGVVGLHMQALKDFQSEHEQEVEPEEVEYAEYEEVPDEPADADSHPLL